MKVKTKVRLSGTLLIAISWGLGRFINPYWLWLSVFIGVIILQGAFTGFAPFTTLFSALSRQKDA